jgi:hypothetical protein
LDGKPVPIAASFDVGPQTFDITFDHRLQPGPIVAASFIFSVGSTRYVATFATCEHTHVTGTVEYYDSNPVDTCFSWAATPADIVSRRGEAADPIVNYPLA